MPAAKESSSVGEVTSQVDPVDVDANRTVSAKKKKNKNVSKRLKWKKRREKKLYSRKERLARKAQNSANSNVVAHAISLNQKRAQEYLYQWRHDLTNWTFKKNEQSWLIKHAFDETLLPRKDFSILKKYLTNVASAARSNLIERCENILTSSQTQAAFVDVAEQSSKLDTNLESEESNIQTVRARKLLKVLNHPLPE